MALVNGKNVQTVQPLFLSIDEPRECFVGNLIDLKCGHTQRPSDLETVMFSKHLEAAGFCKPTRSSVVASPARKLDNPGSPNKKSLAGPKRKLVPGSTSSKAPSPASHAKGKASLGSDASRRRALTMAEPATIGLKPAQDSQIANSACKLLTYENQDEEASLIGHS